MRKRAFRDKHARGFTLLELMIGSVIMLIVVIGALSMYVKSNKTAADQQQYVRLQQDVRAALYFITRDVRMAGAGLTSNFLTDALEGIDNENQSGPVEPDRLKIMGNIEAPFSLTIQSCSGNGQHITLEDYSLEQYPYPDAYYVGKIVLITPRSSSTCQGSAFRQITNVRHNPHGKNEGFNFSPNQPSGFNPPGGLKSLCDDAEYEGGTITLCDVREYWLDTTGFAAGLAAGENGYIGGGTAGVLYLTSNGVHYPVAQNIENLQFRYNGNFDGDVANILDGFQDWNSFWTSEQISQIRQVRIWVVGRTPTRFVSVSATPAGGVYLYRRPAMANSPAASTDDWHKRFLLESTSSIRNMSLSIYNKD